MNFAPLTFVDASRATAGYVTRYKSLAKPGDEWPLPHLPLRTDGKDNALLADWKSMRTLLSTIRAAGAPMLDGKPAHIESALVFALNPHDRIEWDDAPKSPGAWLWLTLIPAPSCALFSGIESFLPAVGMITAVSRLLPFSAINLSTSPAVFLVMDARKPDGA